MLQLILMEVLKLRGINANRALLREIKKNMCLVLEHYFLLTISEGFATDGDIAMPIPINAGTVYPERF
jgi:hypothetical protein